MVRWLRSELRCQGGQGTVEYVLLLMGIAALAALARQSGNMPRLVRTGLEKFAAALAAVQN
jgi:hypothetical protein